MTIPPNWQRRPHTNYSPDWDLSTIPDDVLQAESGRRLPRKSKSEQPCVQCGRPLSARERRKPCPECGARNPRKL